MKSKLKQILTILISSIITLSTVIEPLPVFAASSGTGTNVTQSTSQTATFKHNHVTAGSAVTTNRQIQSNKTIAANTARTAQSVCYYVLNEHKHEGDKTNGGNCYGKSYHVHTSACPQSYTKRYSFENVGYVFTDFVVKNFHCPVCNEIHQGGSIVVVDMLNSLPHDLAYPISRTNNKEWPAFKTNTEQGVVGALGYSYGTGLKYIYTPSADGTMNSMDFGGSAVDVTSRMQAYLPAEQIWLRKNYVTLQTGGETISWYGAFAYYDRVNQKFVNANGIRCGYSSKPCNDSYATVYTCGRNNLTFEGYALKESLASFNYKDPYDKTKYYTSDCPYSAGATVLTAKLSADANNKLTLNLTNKGSATKYTVVWTKPSGTTVTSVTNGNTNNQSYTLQCDEIGTYKCTVSAKSSIHGTNNVDEGSHTFTYTPVSKNTTVNFYDYDNTTKLYTLTMKRGSETSPVTVPTRTGYTFSQFTDAKTGGTQYYDKNGKNTKGVFCPLNGGTINLYAKYNPNTYNITYKLNGGTHGSSHPNTATFDTAFNVSNPTRKGFEFKGWSISGCSTNNTHYYGTTNATGSSFTEASKTYETIGKATYFKNLQSTTNATVTLTAIWMDNEAPDLTVTTVTTEDGKPYTPNTWTKQSVTVTGDGDDETGITGSTVSDKEKGTVKTGDPVTYTYTETGIYEGNIDTEDKAGTTNNTDGSAWIPNPNGNFHTKKPYGPIKIDKTLPEGEVTYSPDVDTNGDVVVTIIASDAHSGLHDTPYSWDNGATWTKTPTKTVTYNTSGTVLVRDAVDNRLSVPWKITWIDKITPQVKSSVDYKIGGVSKNNSNTYGNEAKTYTSTGVVNISETEISLPWSNSDVTLSWNVDDLPNNYFIATGVKTSTLVETDSTYTVQKSTLIDTTNKSYDYTDSIEGTRYFKLTVSDKVGNRTVIKYTVRVDKSKASYIQAKSLVHMSDLSDYSDAEIEERVNNGTGFPSQFKFYFQDDNLTANRTAVNDNSGIQKVVLKLWNANNESEWKEYDLTENTSQISKTLLNDARIFASLYSEDIDTYSDFPNAYELKYTVTVTDYAGNTADYGLTGTLPNYSIKANIYSDEDNIFNVDANGGIDNLPYFKTGDMGHVEIWTIGYVESVGFDFKDVGEIAIEQIEEGILDSKYNLGVNSKVGYSRIIANTKATPVKGAYPLNASGDTYAHHYVKVDNGWLSDGILIRIPPSEDLLEDDIPDKPDNSEPEYVYESHKANIYGYKGASNCYDECEYILFGTSRDGIHYRVTHELQ